MKHLNLEATTTPQKMIKEYLESNASDVLAEKINNGVPIEKDGKTLLNKKTLDGFMNYAKGEAQKLAEKGANCACVEDSVVYGWAIHYFEEDSIEGTLYNEDGTEYKKPAPKKKESKPKPKKETVVDTPTETPKKENPPVNEQLSFLDLFSDI